MGAHKRPSWRAMARPVKPGAANSIPRRFARRHRARPMADAGCQAGRLTAGPGRAAHFCGKAGDSGLQAMP